MREHRVRSLGPGGFHEVAYLEWGDPGDPRAVVCVHGLTRNAEDFATLAEALAERRRVLSVDVAGRGRSDWLARAEDYGYPQYCTDLAVVLAHARVRAVDWVGTSMGGLIGMLLAFRPGSPVERLVLNDIGPFVPASALARIASYVGDDPRFTDLAALDAYLREIYAPFGAFTEAQWGRLVRSSARATPDGSLALAYDPRIGEALRASPPADVDLWAVWEAVRCPVLVLRGETSDVLRPETAAEMSRRGPGAELVEIPGVGHAPALMSPGQIRIISEWLERAKL